MPLHTGVTVYDLLCCMFQEVVDVFDFAIGSRISWAGVNVLKCESFG